MRWNESMTTAEQKQSSQVLGKLMNFPAFKSMVSIVAEGQSITLASKSSTKMAKLVYDKVKSNVFMFYSLGMDLPTVSAYDS